MILENLRVDTSRIALEWVSAAESPRFVKLITEFTARIRDLGLIGESEGLNRQVLIHKIKAAKMAMEGMKLRMAFAKQARQIKKEGTYGKLPSMEKLASTFMNEMTLYETFLYLQEKDRPVSELSELLNVSADRVTSCIESLRKKKLWNGVSHGESIFR